RTGRTFFSKNSTRATSSPDGSANAGEIARREPQARKRLRSAEVLIAVLLVIDRVGLLGFLGERRGRHDRAPAPADPHFVPPAGSAVHLGQEYEVQAGIAMHAPAPHAPGGRLDRAQGFALAVDPEEDLVLALPARDDLADPELRLAGSHGLGAGEDCPGPDVQLRLLEQG